jgi:hypothetical protein
MLEKFTPQKSPLIGAFLFVLYYLAAGASAFLASAFLASFLALGALTSFLASALAGAAGAGASAATANDANANDTANNNAFILFSLLKFQKNVPCEHNTI